MSASAGCASRSTRGSTRSAANRRCRSRCSPTSPAADCGTSPRLPAGRRRMPPRTCVTRVEHVSTASVDGCGAARQLGVSLPPSSPNRFLRSAPRVRQRTGTRCRPRVARKESVMTKRITGPLIAAVLVVAAIALAGIAVFNRAQAQGQQPPAVRIQVVVIQLKPDMMTTWEDLQKNEMIPAQKKAGLPWRHTLANGASGPGFTRITIVPLANYAQLDMPGFIQRAVSAEANANYNAKLRTTILSQHTAIATFQPDLSIQSNATTPLGFQVVQTAELL